MSIEFNQDILMLSDPSVISIRIGEDGKLAAEHIFQDDPDYQKIIARNAERYYRHRVAGFGDDDEHEEEV